MDLEAVYRKAPIWAQELFLNLYALGIEAHRYGPAQRRLVKRLLEKEEWSRPRLEAYRDARLRKVVSAAYAGSPYYRRIMSERGLKPSDIEGTRDLPKLPLLKRDTVRSHARELLTGRPRLGWIEGHTSGTTGSPLALWYDRATCLMTNAVDRRQKIWGGMADDDWLGMFLGRVIVPTEQDEPPFWRSNVVQRQVWFSSFHMSPENLDRYVEEIRRAGLRFLEGYPSTLYILARHVVSSGERLPMTAVFTSSETLHDVQRSTIEETFECPVFDFYGLAERVIFATECDQHDGKHLAEEFGITEVVDESGRPVPDGESGYLVGTSLHNEAMPLIRYRTGDISAIQSTPCGCGRTLRRMRDVTTKAEDIIVTPDGRTLSPSVLTHPFKPFHQLLSSQIVQDRIDHILVKLVPSAEFTEAHERSLRSRLQERLGPEVEIDTVRVEDLPREASGKFRWVVSEVDHPLKVQWDE